MGNLDIFHVSFGSKIKAPTVRRWELRGITARRGEVDGATPFAHGEAHRLDARPALVRSTLRRQEGSDDKRRVAAAPRLRPWKRARPY